MSTRRRSRKPTIYLGVGIPGVVGHVFRRHHFDVVAIEDDPELQRQDDETLLAQLYELNGVLVTQDPLLYPALTRARPRVRHAGIIVIPASYPTDRIARLTHLIARWYRAAVISGPFGGRNRLLYSGSDGLRVLDTSLDIGGRDLLAFPWDWWETSDEEGRAEP